MSNSCAAEETGRERMTRMQLQRGWSRVGEGTYETGVESELGTSSREQDPSRSVAPARVSCNQAVTHCCPTECQDAVMKITRHPGAVWQIAERRVPQTWTAFRADGAYGLYIISPPKLRQNAPRTSLAASKNVFAARRWAHLLISRAAGIQVSSLFPTGTDPGMR